MASRVKKWATIRDVAEKAGVSIATVSFVLNKRAGEAISERVRKRVLKAAAALDYHPSASARGLARKRTHNIAIIFYRDPSSIANAFYSFVVQGVIKETTKRQYNLLFSFVDEVYRGSKDLPQALREQNTEGVLLMHMTSVKMVEDIKRFGVPMVAIDVYPHLDGVPAIETDNHAGAMLATQHLLDLGHKRVVFLHGALERTSIGERAAGFQEAMTSAGHTKLPRSAMVACDDLSFEASYARTKRLLVSKRRPTGIVCANDEVATGVLRAAADVGVRVPEQLSVVGFDDIEMSRFTQPPLTTVGIDKEGMGRTAVNILIDTVEGKNPGAPARVPVKLIKRKSTAAPPKG
jgi:LacI family transcriptional regulator